jgi:hypothetical protein
LSSTLFLLHTTYLWWPQFLFLLFFYVFYMVFNNSSLFISMSNLI